MHDVRLAIRSLRATPVVSAVAALSLALGIGANTAIFSLVNGLLLRALPVRDAERLALVQSFEAGTLANDTWTYPIWDQIRQRRELFSGAAAWSANRFNLSASGETDYVDGLWASGRYFDTFGVTAVAGRTFTDADDQRNGGPDGAVAVISYAYWQRKYGGGADVVGRTIAIDRVPFTIVGVTPPEFFGAEVGRAFDVAVPLGCEPLLRGKETNLDRRSSWWLTVMVRLKPGQSTEAASAALRGVQPQIREATLPTDWRPGELSQYFKEPLTLVEGATGNSYMRRRYQRPLWTLMVVVSLVLLVACANIANLLLARATARRHELSVRLALGASRARLVRQLFAESLLLSAIGAAGGLLVAQWGSRLLVGQLSTATNTVFLDLSIDWHILAFAIAATVATALLFGTAPAFRAAGVAPIDALKEQGRGAVGDSRGRVANALVVAQVALSVVLVVGAGLFVRSFTSLTSLRLGFDRDKVLVVNIGAQRASIAATERIPVLERVASAARVLPGVADAAMSVVTPVSGSTWNNRVEVSGAVDLPDRQRQTLVNYVTPGWFAAYGTPLVAGRGFDDHDTKTSAPVVIVNEAFARRFFNGASPLGHTVATAGPVNRANRPTPPMAIVGVAADAVYRNLREPMSPTMYAPLSQYDDTRFPLPAAALSVRAGQGSPALLARSVAAAIRDVNPDFSLTFRPLADQVNASLTQERLIAMLSGFFGVLALLLAGLGLYGVTSYAVTRRRMEIGIRMALGAAPAGVVRLVLARVTLLVGAGVAVGAVISLWASRFVATLLFGLEPRDPVTLAGSVAALAAVGALAGWLPAHRASRIDPADVLRDA
jgi:putative ABC transport system permease protein